MAHGGPPFAVVRKNVRARGPPGVVERLLEALCETRMETPPASPMGLASQSLLVRDDGGGLCHPFQYCGAGPTSASELKPRIYEEKFAPTITLFEHAKGHLRVRCLTHLL